MSKSFSVHGLLLSASALLAGCNATMPSAQNVATSGVTGATPASPATATQTAGNALSGMWDRTKETAGAVRDRMTGATSGKTEESKPAVVANPCDTAKVRVVAAADFAKTHVPSAPNYGRIEAVFKANGGRDNFKVVAGDKKAYQLVPNIDTTPAIDRTSGAAKIAGNMGLGGAVTAANADVAAFNVKFSNERLSALTACKAQIASPKNAPDLR